MKCKLFSVLVMVGVSANIVACGGSGGSSRGGQAGAWQRVASMADGDSRYNGFGARSNGEFVIAGGTIGWGTGAMTSSVSFCRPNGSVLDVVRTAYLPEVMIKPAVVEINGTLYIFDGGHITARKPSPVRSVYRYDENNNSFVAEASDPGFYFYNYAGRYDNRLFSLNPPEHFSGGPAGTPPIPASLQKFTPGSGWTSQQIADLPQTGTVAVIGSTAYAFGGHVVNVGPNTNVHTVNLNTGAVTKLPVTTLPREGGAVAIVVNGLIHLHGPGLDQTPEVFDPATNQVTVRSDLGAPEAMDWPVVVSGQYVLIHNVPAKIRTVYRYQP